MANLNKVFLMGNLTADPEAKQLPSGRSVTSFSIAVNRPGKDEAGNTQQNTTYLDITCWDRTAENAARYLSKGRPVFVEGRITQETWTDRQTGQQRSRLRITAENLQFLGSGQQQGNGYQQQTQTQSRQAPANRRPTSPPPPPPTPPIDDDCPF